MSTISNLRSDKTCLNCGADVPVKFCSECGQLNREPQIGIKGLFQDIIHTVFHFDGKFFTTIKILFTKPGFLTQEYLAGRRAKYLPPVQLYLFTSAFFFFILFTFFMTPSSVATDVNAIDVKGKNMVMEVEGVSLSTIQQYEKQQAALPSGQRDGFLSQYLTKKTIIFLQKFRNDPRKVIQQSLSNFISNFSSLFFISLPLIACLLRLLFFRRKDIGLGGHFIFITHNYVFSYMMMLLSLLLGALATVKGLGFVEFLLSLLLIWGLIYGFMSMKNFYLLSRAKTFLIYAATLFGSMVVLLFLFLVYFFISVGSI